MMERCDLVNDNLKLIQETDGLTFGTDALLLAKGVLGTKTTADMSFEELREGMGSLKWYEADKKNQYSQQNTNSTSKNTSPSVVLSGDYKICKKAEKNVLLI